MFHRYWHMVLDFSKIISIHELKFWPNPKFFKIEIKNYGLISLKIFPRPLLPKNLPFCRILVISIISDINLPVSPMFLFWTYTVRCTDIRHGKPTFNFFASASLDNIFISTFNNELCLQFLIYFWSLSFFINLIIACLWEILNPFFP